MDVANLQQKLCKGVKAPDDDDGFWRIEKVLAPFMRTLKKRKHEKADVMPTDYEELYLKQNTQQLLLRLQHGFSDPLGFRTLLNETAELLKVVTKSKSVNLYLTNYESGEIMLCPKQYPDSIRFQKKYTIESGTYLAAYVAHTKEYVISSDILGDVRFPQGIPDVPVVKSVICLPIMTSVSGNCIGVIELYRECSDRPYDLINLQICNALTAWMGIAIEQNKNVQQYIKEGEIQKQLCALCDLYFSGLVPFNKIISDFMKISKTAVNAEKGAFYVFREPVVPYRDEALWADAYEEGQDEANETVMYKRRDRLKFMKNKPGVAGYAARTGEVINIQDAYRDYRFDKKADSPFYRTRTILAIPIKNENGVLGVISLINSLSYPYFRMEDINLMLSFSGFLNLICDYYFLENTYSKTQLRLVSTNKILDFHTKPPPEELNNFKTLMQTDSTIPPWFFKFDWEMTNYDDEVLKIVGAIFNYTEILDSCFEVLNLADFILRIKKAYRPAAFHNFDHAFQVLHFVFNIFVKNKDHYTTEEIVATLLAALCHDVDHSGFTNSFLTLKNDVIYKLYGDFCGEAHRCEFVFYLIQQTDLLYNFSEASTQAIFRTLKKLMLSFDLAIHFQNRQKIIGLLTSEEFSFEDQEHRLLVLNLILIIADNCANFKSFDYVKKVTSQYYKEIYRQGDLEKSMGFTPLPMLDRNKHDLVPENQSIYLVTVVLPCVQILAHLFSHLIILEDLLSDTIFKWNELVTLRGREVWKLNEAVLKERRDRRTSHRVTLASTLSSLRTIVSETRSERF